MSAAATLAEWNAKFGDTDYTKVSDKWHATTNVFYTCNIRHASLCMSSREDRQIKLDLEVVCGDTGKHVALITEWLSLPMQPVTDMNPNLTADQVKKLTMTRRNQLTAILACVDPARYTVGEYVHTPDGGHEFMDKDGYPIPRSKVDEKRVEINEHVMEFVKELHERFETCPDTPIEEWNGAQVYMRKKDNDRNPKYPYTNFFAYVPSDADMYVLKS